MREAHSTTALAVLKDRFGFDRFRPGQREIVDAVLEGRDVLAVMPTGGGKSLGFSLPALLLDAPVLVVSPLIALMKDQVDGLLAQEIPASYVNSTVSPGEQRLRIQAFREGRLRLLYVAPERFRSDRFREALSGFRPGLFAIDEAHCISEWGHDFRPDYLRLREAAEELSRPPILALTATATAEVREHICDNLGLRQPTIIIEGFERPNLDFAVEAIPTRPQKLERARELVREGGRGIVYASTRKNVESVALGLREAGLKAGFYHAGLRDDDRRKVQDRFRSGALPVVVATNAFGMGIDRPDLRFVIHHDLPGSVEAYTQEAGRAGRDGEPARCVLLYQAGDARLQRFFIETAYPSRQVILSVLHGLRALAGQGQDEVIDEERLIDCAPERTHPRAVDSSLRILAENGLVARGLAQDGRRRVARFVTAGTIDFEHLQERAAREFQLLHHMIEYAERAGCHRAYLVNYFAGPGTVDDCGACEGCRRQDSRREITEDEVATVRCLLRLLCDLDGRYGRRRIINILAGSKAKEILANQLDQLPHYGSLSRLPTAFIDRLMNECIAVDLARVAAGEYPVVGITEKGRLLLEGRTSIHLSCFDERPRKKTRSTPKVQDDPQRPMDPAVLALVERLRDWRNSRARGDSVPAYVILHDRTLAELARDQPSTEKELLGVKGIGPAKAEKYGQEILELLRS